MLSHRLFILWFCIFIIECSSAYVFTLYKKNRVVRTRGRIIFCANSFISYALPLTIFLNIAFGSSHPIKISRRTSLLNFALFIQNHYWLSGLFSTFIFSISASFLACIASSIFLCLLVILLPLIKIDATYTL